MTAIVLMVLLLLASVVACHAVAKRRGGNPVFWGLMGLLFGGSGRVWFMGHPGQESGGTEKRGFAVPSFSVTWATENGGASVHHGNL